MSEKQVGEISRRADQDRDHRVVPFERLKSGVFGRGGIVNEKKEERNCSLLSALNCRGKMAMLSWRQVMRWLPSSKSRFSAQRH